MFWRFDGMRVIPKGGRLAPLAHENCNLRKPSIL